MTTSNHTISTALRRIAELKGEIKRLKTRALKCAYWTGETKPSFSYAKVMEEILKRKDEMVDLKTRIAAANASNKAEAREAPLQRLVFELAEFKDALAFLESHQQIGAAHEVLIRTEQHKVDPTTRQYVTVEVQTPHHFAVTEAEKEEQADKLRAEISRLNNLLERHNHTVKV